MEATVFKPSKLRTYLKLAEDAGMSADAILDGSGATWADIHALKPFDLPAIARMFDLLATRTPPGFAITSAYSSRVRNYGVVGFATMSMPTLREAFQHWSRYSLIAGDPLVTTIEEHGDEWRMDFETRIEMSPAARRYCIEAAVAALEPVIEELTNQPASGLRIDFAFDRGDAPDVYGLFRTSNLRFSRKSTAYYGHRSDLDRPIPTSDEFVQTLFHQQCDQYLTELVHTRTLAERMEDLLRESAGNLPSLDEIATALGMSRRTIQRQLGEEGLSFHEVVKRFRQRHAYMLLREPSPNMKAIAHTLGFREVGNFRRAFREWTGLSVGEWLDRN